MIIAVTGHRSEDTRGEEDVRSKFRDVFRREAPAVVICGLANGVDLWAADEARLLGIPVWCARPWAGHGPRKEDIDLYTSIVVYADMVVNVDESKEYQGPWVYHRRNEWMVDNATHVLAYLNPEKKSGGTYACVRYANKVGKPVRNIYG